MCSTKKNSNKSNLNILKEISTFYTFLSLSACLQVLNAHYLEVVFYLLSIMKRLFCNKTGGNIFVDLSYESCWAGWGFCYCPRRGDWSLSVYQSIDTVIPQLKFFCSLLRLSVHCRPPVFLLLFSLLD